MAQDDDSTINIVNGIIIIITNAAMYNTYVRKQNDTSQLDKDTAYYEALRTHQTRSVDIRLSTWHRLFLTQNTTC